MKAHKSKKFIAGSVLVAGSLLASGFGATTLYAQENNQVSENATSISGLKSTYQSKDRIVITWDDFPDASHYAIEFYYEDSGEQVYDYYERNNNWFTLETGSGTDVRFVVSPIFEDLGNPDYDFSAEITASTKGIPAPSSVTVSNETDQSALVAWEASQGATKYLIRKVEEDGTTSKIRTVYADEANEKLSYTIKNLEPLTDYKIQITAVDATGDRSSSRTRNFKTLKTPLKENLQGNINNLRSTYQSKNKIVTTWDKVNNADGYKIVWLNANGSEESEVVNKNWFTLQTVSGRQHNITVMPVYSGEAAEDQKSVIAASSKGVTAPEHVTIEKLEKEGQFDERIHIEWDNAEDAVKYLVRAKQADGTYIKAATEPAWRGSSTLYGSELLQASTFKVIAVNADGEQSTHIEISL